MSIYRRGLQSMQVRTKKIKQGPTTLEEAAGIAMLEISILSHVRCGSSEKAMDFDHHRR